MKLTKKEAQKTPDGQVIKNAYATGKTVISFDGVLEVRVLVGDKNILAPDKYKSSLYIEIPGVPNVWAETYIHFEASPCELTEELYGTKLNELRGFVDLFANI